MKHTAVLLTLAALFLLSISPVAGQTGGGYDLTWSSVDGGGETRSVSTSGGYTLGGTLGQPDAGTLSGGGYSLGGGFWGGGTPAVDYQIYLPLLLRDAP